MGRARSLTAFIGLPTLLALGLHAQEPAPPARPAPPAQSPAFRGGVDVVSLTVTVTDGTQYVTDLTRDDFLVFEDGVKQELTFFNRTQSPIALALLMDTSASMEEKMKTAQEAAIGFARRLRPEDLGELVDFDSRVNISQPFTSDASALERAIRQTSAGGSTALHNAIYVSLKELKKVRATVSEEIRRQAIVVLSDGEDTSSVVPFEEVLELAKRSETAIYSVGLRSRDVNGTRGFKEAEFVLRQLAQETGGRAFFLNDVGELGGIYSQISDELSNQYTLGYSSKNGRRDGQWRRVVVKVNRPGAAARTKQGYYAPAAH
jgi:Ca-activated chloride channel family protein